MLHIHRLAPGDAAAASRWDSFVLGCPQATFFHRAAWQQLMTEVFGHATHYLYAERDGNIAGVLPLSFSQVITSVGAVTCLPINSRTPCASTHAVCA